MTASLIEGFRINLFLSSVHWLHDMSLGSHRCQGCGVTYLLCLSATVVKVLCRWYVSLHGIFKYIFLLFVAPRVTHVGEDYPEPALNSCKRPLRILTSLDDCSLHVRNHTDALAWVEDTGRPERPCCQHPNIDLQPFRQGHVMASCHQSSASPDFR